jgi:pimeloyl-ACP methyl ester carboxylesterase
MCWTLGARDRIVAAMTPRPSSLAPALRVPAAPTAGAPPRRAAAPIPARRGASLGLGAALALAAGACATTATEDAASPTERRGAEGALAQDVLLVHGAWADGSSWSGVIERLQREGFTVRAVQLPLQTLAGDAAIVRREIDRIGRPVVVAGHSYGGAVIGQAAAGSAHVVGLVYAAGYALEEGETLGALNARYAPTPIVAALAFDSQGNATVQPDAFVRLFAPDVPAREARVLAAVQAPISGAIFGAPGGAQAWRTVPSWYQVSAQDQVIQPELQRFMAARMKAHVVELPVSHASPLARPRAIADLIVAAAAKR